MSIYYVHYFWFSGLFVKVFTLNPVLVLFMDKNFIRGVPQGLVLGPTYLSNLFVVKIIV